MTRRTRYPTTVPDDQWVDRIERWLPAARIERDEDGAEWWVVYLRGGWRLRAGSYEGAWDAIAERHARGVVDPRMPSAMGFGGSPTKALETLLDDATRYDMTTVVAYLRRRGVETYEERHPGLRLEDTP